MAKIDLLQALANVSRTQKQYVDNLMKRELVERTINESVLNLTTDRFQYVEMVDGTNITLPEVEGFTEIHLFFSTSTELTLIMPVAVYQKTPELVADRVYEFIFTYTDQWLCGFIEYGGDGTVSGSGGSSVATSVSWENIINKPNGFTANGGNADTINGYSIWVGTQDELDAILNRDPNTIYLVKG